MPLRHRTTLLAGLFLGTTIALMAVAACSSAVQSPGSRTVQSTEAPFAWFKPAPAPAGWKTMELPDGTGVLSVPPDASPVESDPGSVSAAVSSSTGELAIYLNATPRQGSETLDNWNSFRLDHLADENSSSPSEIAERTGMAFRGGTGSCVEDSYVTHVGNNRYREIACLVAGSKGSSVLIVAAPADSWPLYSPVMEQAVNAYRAG
ncbi:hypothetical protein [Arthrobacter sp. FW306-2-2C-D06B]|uniref:hypothetical protein n=1 Tax=Arthrobacter sp. FW306-2-2C-D06B TaxID=2879618 RepID=UPI001F20A43A|nr:hypothetical protein [Arthrobacter sp. FW306-2-2C-D06B]UKA57063.1 hypothetical protein LFT47_12105 [Arthrobacter sp. FW306-2-2C-D06B]